MHQIPHAIAEGWRVVSVTAQHVASSSSQTIRGGFFVVLERDDAKLINKVTSDRISF